MTKMSLSPGSQDLRLFQYLAPNTFSQLLVQSQTVSKSSRSKESISSPNIESGHEESDADPSPHAQPPASTPLIKSEPDSQSTNATHDVDDTSQGPGQRAAESTAAQIMAIPDNVGAPAVRSPSPFSAEVNLLDHDYMSDHDLQEKTFRQSQGYDKLSLAARRVWETKRAETLFRAGEPKHFECSEHLLGGRACSTLQEYLPSRLVARPVISSFFGHNKSGWDHVIKSVRVFLCRKCYQRHENRLHSHMAPIQLPLCRELVNRLERWRPGCLFTIQLTNPMQERVERFKEKMKKEGSVRRVVAAELDAEELEGKGSKNKRATNTPVLFAIRLERRFGGDNKTADELHDLFDWLDTKLADGTIEDLPAFEAVLEERPEDAEQFQAQKKRRDAAMKPLRMRVPIGPTPASEQTAESEHTPTHRPARAAPRKILRTAKGSRATNAVSSSQSQANLSTTCEPAGPSAHPKIILKLKGKKPVRADSMVDETQPGINKKRKRATVATSEDSKSEEESTAPTKKPRIAKLVVEAARKQSVPVEEVAEVPTLAPANGGQTRAYGEQHVQVTNGTTQLASFTLSDLKVIIDFAPGS
jgi:hypothetical protein